MSGNDIIKALEHCRIGKRENDCKKCPLYGRVPACVGYLAQNALALINRLKAENETLKAIIEAAEDHYNPLPFKGIFDEKIAEAKAEAFKEFAERFSEKLGKSKEIINICVDGVCESLADIINNLVKELTEEKE